MYFRAGYGPADYPTEKVNYKTETTKYFFGCSEFSFVHFIGMGCQAFVGAI